MAVTLPREAQTASTSSAGRRTWRRSNGSGRRSTQRPRLAPRADTEGSGGADGIVIPMGLDGDGVQESVYTLPISLGPEDSQQDFHLQVDTGSSDLWLAAKACTNSICQKTKLYDPSSATATGQDFDIQYLQGNASGPIYWDQLDTGGYSISQQALGAVESLASEPLDSAYSGVLGLALPLNSIIEQKIPAQDGNSPDGATFASNLFGITPASDAPAARFISLALERPGIDDVPSLFGIGRHPAALVPNASMISYTSLVRNSAGVFFWESFVRGINVYVNGTARPITLPKSTSGAVFPQAVLDTGVPYILATTDIANAIYGALGIGPAQDGNYYVPCTTPINMTVTLYNIPEQPLHPLDLSYSVESGSSSCMGAIQTASGALDSSTHVADLILGVPFLRNTYTVLAYDQPYSNGTFPNATGTDTNPHLGIMNLLNVTKAMEQFEQVRVQGKPLTGSYPTAAGTSEEETHGLSVGIKVLIGILCFLGLCALLFGGGFFLMRRRWRARVAAGADVAGDGDRKDGMGGMEFGELRKRPSYRTMVRSDYTDDSARTRVGGGGDGYDKSSLGEGGKDVGGFLNLDPWDTSGWRTTVTSDSVPEPAGGYEAPGITYEPYQPVAVDSPTTATLPVPDSPELGRNGRHERSVSGGPGVTEPLMTHRASHSLGSNTDVGVGGVNELGERAVGEGERGSMVGIGTANRSRSAARSQSRTRSMLVDIGPGTPSPMHGEFELGSSSTAAARMSPSLSRGRPLGSPPLNSPRPGSLADGPMPYVPPAAIMESNDYDFLARRSRAFDLQDPPVGSKRGKKS
ncbi:acid protease [Peniophora sp. CONT]|nr:acid protease [Peniophora sp. CONT]